jgi:hypothetical protein
MGREAAMHLLLAHRLEAASLYSDQPSTVVAAGDFAP